MGLFELTLDIRFLSLKVILFVKSKRNSVIVGTEPFTVRIGVGTGRLDIFLIIFGITNIRQRYYDSGAINFIS
jgi:hypothetical protein